MRRIYFKVIEKHSRTSIAVMNTRIHYPVKQWVKPQIQHSKIFVFKTREAAEHFCDYELKCGNPIIVPCYVKNPSVKSILPMMFCSKSVSALELFWNAYRIAKLKHKSLCKSLTNFMDLNTPSGTVYCDEVYCLE